MARPSEEISRSNAQGSQKTDANLANDSLHLGGIPAEEYATKAFVQWYHDTKELLLKEYIDSQDLAKLQEAKAYIDPSVMTYAIQAIAGIAIALGTFFNIYWRKIRKKIGWNGLFSTKYSKTESDDLYFDDPVSHQHIQPELNTEPETHTVKEREPFLRNFWGEYKYALILAASVSFLVMIFSPLDLYFNNVKEFWFDFGIACPILIKSFILCFLGLSAIFLVCLLLLIRHIL